jgi:hypothetical protein
MMRLIGLANTVVISGQAGVIDMLVVRLQKEITPARLVHVENHCPVIVDR